MKGGAHESNVAKIREKMAYFVGDVGLGCFSRAQRGTQKGHVY